MKRYAISYEVQNECDYLTTGKEYEIRNWEDGWGDIISDTGFRCLIVFGGCAHLNGKPWRIVERES